MEDLKISELSSGTPLPTDIVPYTDIVAGVTKSTTIESIGSALDITQYQKESEKGVANGYASLDGTGKVPASQLPASSAGVTSVNGKVGDVVLDAADVGAASGGVAAGAALYFTNQTSTVVGTYKQISYTNDVSTSTFSAVANNNEVLIATTLFEQELGITEIPAGIWSGNLHSKVSSAVGVSTIRVEVFVRASGGTETTLFSKTPPELNNTDYSDLEFRSTQETLTVNATDRLGIRIYGATTSNANTTISIQVGDDTASWFTTPLPLRHSLLRELGWDMSGHTGTASKLAGFDSSGNATFYDLAGTGTVTGTGTSGKLAKWTSSTAIGDATAGTDYPAPETSVQEYTRDVIVRAASTANLTLSGTQTVDGIALVAGDYFLAKNQTTASQNGVYVVAASAWTRATEFSTTNDFNKKDIFVTSGTTLSGTWWLSATKNPTVGTTSVTFAQIPFGIGTGADQAAAGNHAHTSIAASAASSFGAAVSYRYTSRTATASTATTDNYVVFSGSTAAQVETMPDGVALANNSGREITYVNRSSVSWILRPFTSNTINGTAVDFTLLAGRWIKLYNIAADQWITSGYGLNGTEASGGGSGTVTSVSVASANGLAGTVANATTTPAITLSTSVTGVLKGNGTAISAATSGADYVSPTGTENVSNKTITASTLNGVTLSTSQGTSNFLRGDGTYAAPAGGSGGAQFVISLADYQGSAISGILGKFTAPYAMTLAEVTPICDALPTGSNLIFELRLNGSSGSNILSSTCQVTTSESATNGQYIGTPVTSFTSGSIADGANLTAVITGAGSTLPAYNPRLLLRFSA